MRTKPYSALIEVPWDCRSYSSDWRDGIGAHNNGVARTSNPNQAPEMIKHREAWFRGWDAAHEALAGGLPDLALDVIWPRLCMVNLKSAFWKRTNGPEAEHAEWERYWTGGRHGRANWPAVAKELMARGYAGVICLTAEYSDEDSVDRLIAEDIAFAKSLVA